jgi:hypothetical protein
MNPSITTTTSAVSTFPTLHELRGAVWGTVLYLSLYLIGFIQFQSYTKFYIYYYKYKNRKLKSDDDATTSSSSSSTSSAAITSFRNVKYYNTTDLLALNGDRTVGNFLEQAILFLPLLWIHALFINAQMSFHICILYTTIRSIYPFVFYTKYMFLCTIPGYMILFYLMYEIVTKI